MLFQLWDVKYLLEEDDDAIEEEKQEEVAGSSRSNVDAPDENGIAAPVSMVVESDEDTDTGKSGEVYLLFLFMVVI